MYKYFFITVGLVLMISGCTQFNANDKSNEHIKIGMVGEETPDKDASEMNPYVGFSERYDSWRYDLFEIFRGAEVLSIDDLLLSSQSYGESAPDEIEPTSEYVHQLTCNISLPQFAAAYTWSKKVNAYYQNELNQCVLEGEDMYYGSLSAGTAVELTYSYEGTYQVGNIITVVRSRLMGGWRTRMEPFAEIFSAIDGSPLTMDDLFCVDRETYLPVVQASLKNAQNRFSEHYLQSTDDSPTGIFETQALEYFDKASIAVAPVGLVYIYPTGYAGSEAMGTVFLDVPFSDLADILNPDYF